MVAPVTGPFTKVFDVKGPPNTLGFKPTWATGYREWRRQKLPYTLQLPFHYERTDVLAFQGGDGTDVINAYQLNELYASSAFLDRIYAHAYDKFFDRVRGAAELGATLATWRQSHDMILDRAMKLRLGFKAVRKGDISTLKALWGKGAGIRGNARAAGSNILEYSFGWAPLVGDLADAVNVLGRGGNLDNPKVRFRKKVPYSYNSGWQDLGALQRLTLVDGVAEYSLRATVKVTSQNLLLLNELGLANPATVVWEVIPWSFVIDYFVNVQVFLQSFTDRLGMELEGESSTLFIKTNGSSYGKWDTPFPPVYSPPSYRWETAYLTRTPAIPRPPLVFKLPWRMSVQRGATSIGLLLQQLRK